VLIKTKKGRFEDTKRNNNFWGALSTKMKSAIGAESFVSAYAAIPPNQPQRCILTDYFNNYNFSKLK
jgi:hypothetical protein